LTIKYFSTTIIKMSYREKDTKQYSFHLTDDDNEIINQAKYYRPDLSRSEIVRLALRGGMRFKLSKEEMEKHMARKQDMLDKGGFNDHNV